MSKRAELRRMAKQTPYEFANVIYNKNGLTAEEVSKASGVGLQKLLDWRVQEHNALDEQICKEYQGKLRKASDTIQAACFFAMINTFYGMYKIRFNSDKVVTRYRNEIEKAMSGGIIDSARRAEKSSGLQFEFDDMDMNKEFHLGEYNSRENRKISDMTPNEAYDYGWYWSARMANVLNTALFAEYLIKKGYAVKDVQKCVITLNTKSTEITAKDGQLTKLITKLKEKGVDFGHDVFDLVARFQM